MTVPSPNRTYQQLRTHLAYLKLAAALAGVLDQAEDASHVEVLETPARDRNRSHRNPPAGSRGQHSLT